MNTGIPRNQNDGVYDTYGSAQGDKLSLREGHIIYVRSASLYAEVVTTVTPYPITGSNPALYIQPQNTTPGTGETNTGSNIGLGEGVFAQKSGTDLQFYSQVSQFGLESRLIDDTYYRGLNPFVADNSGSFVGDMAFSRASEEYGPNRSGVVISSAVDVPLYGKGGLWCFDSYTHLLTKNQDLTDASWSSNNVSVSSSSEPDPELGSGFFEVKNTTASPGYLRKVIAISAAEKKPSASCYFKDNGSGFCGIRLSITGGNTSLGTVTYDFTSSLISTVGNVSGIVEKLTNGVVRLFCYIENDGTNTSADVRFYSSDPSGSNPVTVGDSSLLWLPCFTDENSAVYPPAKTDTTQIIVASSSSSIIGNGNLPNQNEDFMFIITTSFPDDGVNRTAIRNGVSSKGIYLRRRDSGSIECRLGDGVSFSNLAKTGVDENIHRFTILYRGGEFKMFIDGVLEASSSGVDHLTDVTDLIRFGEQLNSHIKIEKWLIGSTYTDQQISDLGGPENAIL